APVEVHLLGDEQRHGGEHALPHLAGRRIHGDDVVGADLHPAVRRIRRGLAEGLLERREAAKGDADGRGARRNQERATRNSPESEFHGHTSLAARWIAATIELWVPQR